MQDISGMMKSQFALYQGTSANSLLRVKYAQAERLKQTYKDITAKYDNTKSNRAEANMNAIGDAKLLVADQARALERSLGRLDDMKLQFAAMTTAMGTSSVEAWDLGFSSMQDYAGSSIVDPHNLAGRLGDGSGGFREPVEVLSAGGMNMTVPHHYAAADYSFEMADGTVLEADQNSQTLSGANGMSFAFADLSVSNINGDEVTFHDNASNQDYTATLHRGGNGLMNGWFYNGFTGDGATRAQADLEAANHYIMATQSDWEISTGQVESMISNLGNQLTNATDEYKKVSLENINAKSAELKAAKAKFDLTVNLLSLTSGSATNMIEKMFLTDTSYQKSSLFDVISSA